MNRKMKSVLGVAAAAALALAGCSSGNEPPAAEPFPTGPVTIKLAGWSLASTPEFQTLKEGFEALHSNVTVELVEYDAANYDTQMIADLTAGTAPDIYVQKNLKNFYTYSSEGQLVDVSDVAGRLAAGTGGVDFYKVDGKTFAVPYRQDSWVLYYNKDMFDAAGVDYPDGTWTWDDYADAAEAISTALQVTDPTVFGTYQHRWQSTVQGFALAQSAGASLESGDYGYLKSYYDRVVAIQSADGQVDHGTSQTGNLRYQDQFGLQKAAMIPMGTWYVATLLADRKAGKAQEFDWGIAPAPQFDSSTTGTDKTPVTFGDPTGLGINPAIESGEKLTVAKEFLAYAAGVEAAKALASIGITPANTSDEVVATYFALDGVADDDLSKFAWGKHETLPENPVSEYTATLQNILNDLHTAIMTGSASVDDAIATAEQRAKDEVL
jgi:multiple sugar transport system substrate-binding protein